ncbi:hypothetical protein HPB52_017614 [Rhipicephalus sanguineus]|uniref:Sema domain-containing protein n=1 Tax=Rhipicephalus sanguineus TaxID=34632 RepID=A0A9D4SZG0_RHISA|nr:hypothetical protein HPB52_017614 [Rhipicephalus sanguineus]
MSTSGSSSAASDAESRSSRALSGPDDDERPDQQPAAAGETGAASGHWQEPDAVRVKAPYAYMICGALLAMLVTGFLGSVVTLIVLPSCLRGQEDVRPEKLFQLPLDDITSPNLKLGKDVDCRNHICVVQPIRDGSTLYICGTNSRAPTDWQVQAADLTLVPAADQVPMVGTNVSEQAQGRCPYYVYQTSESLWLDDAPSTGISSVVALTALSTGQYGFFRYGVPNPRGLLLLSTDSSAVQKPDLVGAFSTTEHAYFVFREEGIERKACGARNLSTVARVCKNEVGISTQNADPWTSLMKVRLRCIDSAAANFSFDEIHASHWVRDLESGVLFGAFVSVTRTWAGAANFDSAVCAFSLQDIEEEFASSTFYELIQRDIYTLSRPLHLSQVLSPRPGVTCPPGPRTMSSADARFWVTHPLVTKTPKQRHNRPFYAHAGVAIRSLVAFVLNETWGAWVSSRQGEEYSAYRPLTVVLVMMAMVVSAILGSVLTLLAALSSSSGNTPDVSTVEGATENFPDSIGRDTPTTTIRIMPPTMPSPTTQTTAVTLPVKVFTLGKLYYRSAHVDDDRGHLFVGAMSFICLPLRKVSITAQHWEQLGKDVDCRNHIREVQPIRDGSTLYVCGTNSRSPTDWQVRASDLTLVPAAERVVIDGSNETGKAEGRCSYFVSENNPPLWLDDAPSPGVSSVVAMWRFRNGRSAIYRSAVPNVDPNVPAYSFLLTDPSDTAKFNDASDWLPDLEGGVLFGAFVTFNHGYPDSAVCAFRLEDIERAFNGTSFYELSLSRTSLSKIVRPNSAAYPGTGSACVSDSRTLPPTGPDFLSSHPLLAVPPKQRHDRPFFALPGVAFSGVVAFVLNEAWGSWLVCYVATATGLVMKIAEEIVAVGQTPVPAELVDAFNTTTEPIIKMLVSQKHRSLYVFSDNDVRQYSLDACEERHLECIACVRDPFCGWADTRCLRHVDGPAATTTRTC